MRHGASSRAGVSARKALAVDQKSKEANGKRLRRIEGQVRGLQRMVQEERYCADILLQINAVQHALRSVGKAVMASHLRHCVAQTIRKGSREGAEKMYREIAGLLDFGA